MANESPKGLDLKLKWYVTHSKQQLVITCETAKQQPVKIWDTLTTTTTTTTTAATTTTTTTTRNNMWGALNKNQ